MKRLVFMFLIASMTFAFGPPVAAAMLPSYSYIYTATAIITDIDNGNLMTLTTGAYGMDDATRIRDYVSVIKMPYVASLGSYYLNRKNSNDAIMTAKYRSLPASHFCADMTAILTAADNRSADSYFTAYNPRTWRHDDLREITHNEGVTRV